MTIAQSERDFDRAVTQLAELRGWRSCHFHDSRRQVRPGVFVGDKAAAGFPDRVFTRDSELIFAELKTDKGKLSRAQDEWIAALADIADANDYVRVFVWRPKHWPTIERVLGADRAAVPRALAPPEQRSEAKELADSRPVNTMRKGAHRGCS